MCSGLRIADHSLRSVAGTFEEICLHIKAAMESVEVLPSISTRVVEIPVCYGGEFGEDIEFVAKHHGLTTDEVIAIHTGVEYLVYMIGFTAGFPYLGVLPKRIQSPQRATPRLRIPAGSVGLAGGTNGNLSFCDAWRLAADRSHAASHVSAVRATADRCSSPVTEYGLFAF